MDGENAFRTMRQTRVKMSIDPLGNEPIALVTFPIPEWRRDRHGNHMLLLVTEQERFVCVQPTGKNIDEINQ